MRIPKLAIENYQFTMIVMLALVIAGIISFLTMPRTEDPPVEKSGSSVVVLFPGANPLDLEQLVTEPIETAVNELDDIKRINSIMNDGLAVVHVEFFIGTDPQEKYNDVVQKVNSIRNDLPDEILEIRTNKWQVSDVNILQMALVSDSAAYSSLEDEADRLKKMLEKVAGVRQVKTWAYPEQEVRVAIDLEEMAARNIPLNQIFNAIQSANMNIPGGNIDIGSKRFSIQTSGNYRSLTDIQNTIIHSDGNKIIYLKDVAEVYFDYADETYRARFNSLRAVFITVNQKEGTNIFQVMDDLKEQVARFKTELSASIGLHYVFDQSESVAARLNSFFSNLLQGIILVGLVMLLALSLRAATIVMVAIPVSVLIGIGFVDMSGFGLQQMTIAGLVIVLGILVDNAIVVTENVTRFLKMGHNHQEAAIKGTEQIGWAIVSATVTTVLAFVPMMMIRDITGDFIRSMPVTVVFTLTASLLVALTLTPYLSSRFLEKNEKVRPNRAQRLLDSLIQNQYRKTLNFALNHPTLVITLALVIFLSSLTLFPLVGVSFFPKAHKPQFIINIEMPKGTSLDKTDTVAQYVESVLARRKEIVHYAASVGRGNPRIYYNVIEYNENSTVAQIFVQIQRREVKNLSALIHELRQAFKNYPSAQIEVKELEQGPPVDAPISIKIIGKNLDVLKQLAGEIEKIITSTAGTINTNNPVRSSEADLHLKINRAKAGLLGVPLVEIDRTVRACITGMPISKYRDAEGKEYNIVIRLPVQQKPTLADFDKIYVSSVTGAQVPLTQLATLEFKATPQQINHFSLDRSVTLTADVIGNTSVDQVTREIIHKLAQYDWPPNYQYYIGGEHESREESFGGMYKAIAIALLGVFGVLVLQFRSFSQPVIVFAAIPLAIIGSVLALLITGYSFSFTAFVGLTSLVGIVVNNSIILVDYTNKLRESGKELLEIIKEAGETRFRPIILTTGTTIGGLLPLTLQGGDLWAPMGWTIIGGLLVSTFLTLVVVPVLYKIMTKNQRSK